MNSAAKGVAVLALLVSGPAGFAQEPRAAGVAIWAAEVCLSSGDAAFEHGLAEGVTEADRAALLAVAEAATFECLGLAMEMCERQPTADACLADLGEWVRGTRVEITTRLGVEEITADTAECDHLSEAERARYCEVVSEGVALDAAYEAWRVARSEGDMALESHPPVDLELIR